MPGDRLRLDQLLLERGLAPSRHQAQALIMSGQVLVDDEPIEKVGIRVARDAVLRIRRSSVYVGRGGDKIAPVFDAFGVQAQGRIAIDVGASTGGFTDCLLEKGAARVYAVDVGSNQLALKLRRDSRVVVMEQTHAKDLPNTEFFPQPDLATIDVSFIGLRTVLPYVLSVLEARCHVIGLVKPQFELGPEYVQKGGVVREPRDQLLAVKLVEEHGTNLGLQVLGNMPSPLRGGKKGNQEYFVCFRRE